MNRLSLFIAVTVIVLTGVFFAGKWIFLNDLENRISEETLKNQQEESELTSLREQHDTLKAQIASAPVRAAPRFLATGDEGGLLRRLFDAASATQCLLKEVQIIKSFHVKGNQDEGRPAPAAFRPGGQLPQIDERTGMPVGAETDEGETEWPGVEVIPTRVQLKGTYRSLVAFFNQLRKRAPLFRIRSADLTLEESGIVKGSAILVFPIFEPTTAPAAKTADLAGQ